MSNTYICIDLKSFYASVECRERGLDPITTNLVVADKSRTEKTICLAVSPALKAYGIPGRARLYEVVQKVKDINFERRARAKLHKFDGESFDKLELMKNSNLELTYIAATPRMSVYMKYSTNIYNIYLEYISSEDIIVYSVDEVFCDVTKYLELYKMTAKQLVTKMIQDVYEQTGITATAGIGTNLYLAKIAMDIVAKHVEPNENGVRIAELDEIRYRNILWSHKPITDFWRVGKGYAKKLEKNRIYTMGDIARCSVENEELLYRLFGINAELLIDHAWGWEPCTISQIKKYKPKNNSISSGQVMNCPYDFNKTKLIVKEMVDLLVLDLVRKKIVTDQVVLTIGYDVENLTDPIIREAYNGEITIDRYGRNIPKQAHGSINLKYKTSSSRMIREAVMELYDRIMDKRLLVRRINITANHIISEEAAKEDEKFEQLDFFSNYGTAKGEQENKRIKDEKEQHLQETVLEIKKKYGKNAILKGMNFVEGGTTIQRNGQIGGHNG